MIRFLIRIFIPDYTQVKDAKVRERYGVLGSILGIICNILLFLLKLFAGMATNSIAVISDAFNNLSDTGASVISLASSKLSGRRPDEGHPYGHGRAEYIASLLVSVLIILFGMELFGSSVGKIINADEVSLNPLSAVLLIFTVFVKLWMWSYNRYMGYRINSPVLFAAAKDSLNDVISTSAVVVSALAAPFVSFPIDGIAGAAVSLLILWTGYQIARDTIDRLLGQRPDTELVEHIKNMILDNDMVLGVHDLMVHDYGPGRIIASAHAEVPYNLSLKEVHDVIDTAEKRVRAELNVDLVIHMDPVGEK